MRRIGLRSAGKDSSLTFGMTHSVISTVPSVISTAGRNLLALQDSSLAFGMTPFVIPTVPSVISTAGRNLLALQDSSLAFLGEKFLQNNSNQKGHAPQKIPWWDNGRNENPVGSLVGSP